MKKPVKIDTIKPTTIDTIKQKNDRYKYDRWDKY